MLNRTSTYPVRATKEERKCHLVLGYVPHWLERCLGNMVKGWNAGLEIDKCISIGSIAQSLPQARAAKAAPLIRSATSELHWRAQSMAGGDAARLRSFSRAVSRVPRETASRRVFWRSSFSIQDSDPCANRLQVLNHRQFLHEAWASSSRDPAEAAQAPSPCCIS